MDDVDYIMGVRKKAEINTITTNRQHEFHWQAKIKTTAEKAYKKSKKFATGTKNIVVLKCRDFRLNPIYEGGQYIQDI